MVASFLFGGEDIERGGGERGRVFFPSFSFRPCENCDAHKK